MRPLVFVLSLHFGVTRSPERAAAPAPAAAADPWLSADKAMHFVTAAFVESLSFSALRGVGVGRSRSLAGAAVVAGAVSVGKEIYDKKYGGDPSLKDLTWDGAGMVGAWALLRHTEP